MAPAPPGLATPEGMDPCSRPVRQEIICSPFAKLPAGQPVTGARKCQLHLFPSGHDSQARKTLHPWLGPRGAKPPIHIPRSTLRKAAFLRLRGHAVLTCRRSAGGVFPEKWHGKACRAAFEMLCCSRRLCFMMYFSGCFW